MLKKARGKLTEEEARLVLSKIVKGLRDLYDF